VPALGNGGTFYPVRVFFEKRGRIKYISHLDLTRCITRALGRSRLPVWHTQGFHPHIYVTFALPLSLGYEGVCETMDFRLTERLPMEEVVSRLNGVFPEGLRASRAQPPVNLPGVIASADYEITMEFDHVDGETVKTAFEAFCARPEIPVVKRTKKGERSLDVKPHFLVRGLQAGENAVRMTMRTAAGETLNINPSLVLDAFAQAGGYQADWMQVVRTAILDGDGMNFV